MDFEKLVVKIVNETDCKADSIGDEEYPEYRLTFSIDESRKQEVNIFPFEDDNRNFIRMITYIGKKSEFSSTQLNSFLELNMSLRYGALALYKGQVAMTKGSLFENETDENRIIEELRYLIKMADNFEKTLIGLDRK